MDLTSALILEADNIDFNDLMTLKQTECYRSAIICLIQSTRDPQNPNIYFFTAMVKVLARKFLFENSNLDLRLLLRAVSSHTINVDDMPSLRCIPIEVMESIHKRIMDFLEVELKKSLSLLLKTHVCFHIYFEVLM